MALPRNSEQELACVGKAVAQDPVDEEDLVQKAPTTVLTTALTTALSTAATARHLEDGGEGGGGRLAASGERASGVISGERGEREAAASWGAGRMGDGEGGGGEVAAVLCGEEAGAGAGAAAVAGLGREVAWRGRREGRERRELGWPRRENL